MSALERVRAGGRGLERRLDKVPAQALLDGLRAAGAVSEPEEAALGAPGSSGWVRRLLAWAAARGDRTCQLLLDLLEGLEGPPRPGPFDFYNPQRDAEPAHRSDCPCCRRPDEEEEEGRARNGDEGSRANPEGEEGDHEEEGGNAEEEEEDPKEEGGNPEEEEGDPKEEGGNPEEEEGDPKEEGGNAEEEEEGLEEEDGDTQEDEGPEEEEGGGDEGPEDEAPEEEEEDGGGEEEGGDEE